ncbi:GNAT family N-acetyltransferase [Simiduia aestuariiviva]|uniref:Ribosomal protein S18 acetylase RimI-like enzyme n=1 Tax=Simiduia aestuariiviva TaxID=1510459 RepID=A0A839UNK2_9GAMM|nr:N-acetyltransferase [Simiduia aestuariiviva]MBB3167017.1 ribosomal protein S18 acetylase RimI-like enzyme [Simiduia aestuariiviva]
MTLDAASAADAAALVPLVYSSGPAAFDYVFLADAESFLSQALAQADGSFGHRAHYVVRGATGIDGCVSVFQRDEHLQRNNANVGAIMQWAGWRSPLVLLRGLKVEKLIPAPPANSLHIAHLAVAPELRGQGCGAQLIAFAAERAQSLGLSHLSLDVAADNPRAEALYRRLGFEQQAHRTSQIPGLADHSTLIKAL